MDFERMSGDDGLRNAERAFNADLYNEPNQEAYFAELERRGILNEKKGRAEQERLHAALSARNSPEVATSRMNQILERFQMRGAFVPVQSPAQAGGETQTPKNRWVSWRLVFREQTEEESKKSGNKEKVEIPGRIEKIFCVNDPDESTEELIDDVHWDYEDLKSSAAAIEAAQGADTTQGLQEQEVANVVFSGVVTTDEAKTWLEKNDLRASMRQLLTINSRFPQERDNGWLVSLDEAWLSRGPVPVLYGSRGSRLLKLEGSGYPWVPGCLFLAARKKN